VHVEHLLCKDLVRAGGPCRYCSHLDITRFRLITGSFGGADLRHEKHLIALKTLQKQFLGAKAIWVLDQDLGTLGKLGKLGDIWSSFE